MTSQETVKVGRIRFLALVFLLIALGVTARLAFWQILKGEDLAALAKRQHQALQEITPKRGQILASDGFPLATSKNSWLVWASPPSLSKTPGEIAEELASVLLAEEFTGSDAAELKREAIKKEKARIYDRLTKENAAWVPLKRKVPLTVKEQVEKLGISGLGFDFEEDRLYPEASMAAHLLGFVGSDSAGQPKGYFGLEGYYDLSLTGVSGESISEKDASGRPILIGINRTIQATDGVSLVTHIKRSTQFVVEEKLSEALSKYGAKEGTVIIMDPKTGGILAMTSKPAYEPGNYSEHDKDLFINPAVGKSFEPGSIFKILVMAAALDTKVVEPDTKCDDCDGPKKVDKYTIATWNNEYHPDSTMTDVIKNSDNVGMIFVGEKLGLDRLYDYLVKFGIGKPTNVDLQDEASAFLRPKNKWSNVDLATATFGQGIAVTPLQMLRVAAAIANKGVLVVPQVVDKLKTDTWEEDIKPKDEGRVISEKAAYEITKMMVNAVDNGEAKWAKPQGFSIAGKTGTAQIPVSGHYDEEKTIVSFVGFAPADDPAFVMLVTLREPESSPWGSETAAPLWFSIAKEIFPLLSISPR